MPADEPDRSVTWTEDARARVENAPAFVRPGVLKVTEKRARERGYSVITSEFLTEIRNESMLRVAKVVKSFGFEELTMDAFDVAKQKMKRKPRKLEVIGEIEAYLIGRTEKKVEIIDKFSRYLERIPERGLPWTEEALDRVEGVPDFVRQMASSTIEEEAKKRKEKVITREVVEAALGRLRSGEGGGKPPLPFSAMSTGDGSAEEAEGGDAEPTLKWAEDALVRWARIPFAFARRRVLGRVEAYARQNGIDEVTLAVYEAGKG